MRDMRFYLLTSLIYRANDWPVRQVSLLVNNAGYTYGRTLMELPDIEIERTFKVNILSHYWVSLNVYR